MSKYLKEEIEHKVFSQSEWLEAEIYFNILFVILYL